MTDTLSETAARQKNALTSIYVGLSLAALCSLCVLFEDKTLVTPPTPEQITIAAANDAAEAQRAEQTMAYITGAIGVVDATVHNAARNVSNWSATQVNEYCKRKYWYSNDELPSYCRQYGWRR